MEDYKMKQYRVRDPFAGFLPGIAGIKGIPMWCYYVNRGQGVVSFGVKDKDHAIMEFYPAHTAYQVAERMGFRTFIKEDDLVTEAFSDPKVPHEIEIKMNSLIISEEKAGDHSVKVTYYILPEEDIAALVRKVEIKNESDRSRTLEILDGMPAVIPYGVDMTGLKEMSETSKAWMQAEEPIDHVGFYRVRASMEDSAKVSEIRGGNFAFSINGNGEMLPLIYDPALVFSYDTGFCHAVGLEKNDLRSLFTEEQNKSNEVPCAFFGDKVTLSPNESCVLYELFGQVEELSLLVQFLKNDKDVSYFEGKLSRTSGLTDELSQKIHTHTASPLFDAYSRYTYMDNVLRGGSPVMLGHNKIYYMYSRKHGDLERDYNYFSMLPEQYSQGNGNFRDVNQNRRNDTFFSPFVGDFNIKAFYDLIQPDGYNPLGVEMQSYKINEGKITALLSDVSEEKAAKIKSVVSKSFTPGELAKVCDEDLFFAIMDFAEGKVEGDYKEGYWSDHYTYNLDLIDDYLSIFPEKEQELLTNETYTWFAPSVKVNPRRKRYEKTENGIRQYHSISPEKPLREGKEVRSENGELLQASLAEKLLVLTAVKLATLDPYGMGVEMEGGKPGWYDALNGLPGMLGSSMPESCELLRMALFLQNEVNKYQLSINVFSEAAEFINELHPSMKKLISNIDSKDSLFTFWNDSNDAKEKYRSNIYEGYSGEKVKLPHSDVKQFLSDAIEILSRGMKRAKDYSLESVFPTYFYFDVTDYSEDEDGIYPKSFEVGKMPLFLEGPVRYLKLPLEKPEREEVYHNVKNSRLYDKTLSMYKVNAALAEASIEIGRCRSFTPGWLENESIWLHMEYKYLLELLKGGQYHEFFNDFEKTCVAFLDEDMYGRNPLENSSFIASSANPDKNKWGRGFVARLSGSTAEFLSMWRRMFFGENPFTFEKGELVFKPTPAIPSYLIPDSKVIEATLLGSIPVSYRLSKEDELIPGEYKVSEIVLYYADTFRSVRADRVSGEDAYAIRKGEVNRLEIII